ncbi:FAD synthetase family protein [Bacillus sp. ISL-75]|uniref:FAD synthetase family protein n=1 Tax=Bacillus sp. ISL-75 TaxID=2819137 RepID=UPI001BE9D80B|nr:FAD synthetase family protein [Bacillus sp. ISL-75]
MEIIHVTNTNRQNTLLKAKPCVMALGFFDGVHLGHQQVIKEAKKQAEEKKLPLVIMSFFPHPKEVLSNGKKIVPYLMPMTDKQKIFKKLGADVFYIVQFNTEFASLSPKQFVQRYLLDFGVKQVVAGFDFTYGCRGEGNMTRIKSDSDGRIDGIKVNKIEFEGEKISSTLIRNLIFSGELEKIPRYLGDYYQIKGRVGLNKHNADILVNPYYLLPASGIYEVTVTNKLIASKLTALVFNGMLKLLSLYEQRFPFKENETIRLYWNKRLPKEISNQEDVSQELIGSSGIPGSVPNSLSPGGRKVHRLHLPSLLKW